MCLQLRTAMVDRETGNQNMSVKVHMSNLSRVSFRNVSYYYTELKDTPFSLGIALADEYGHYSVEATLDDLNLGLEKLQNNRNLSLAKAGPWIYCTLTNEESKRMSKLEAVILNVNNTDDDKCDKDLINILLIDAIVTSNLEDYWRSMFATPDSIRPHSDDTSVPLNSDTSYNHISSKPRLNITQEYIVAGKVIIQLFPINV
ncbi:voltage-dependent calcium channel subunit alpha-2/delta-4-like [Saccoglossus kowalevskii]